MTEKDTSKPLRPSVMSIGPSSILLGCRINYGGIGLIEVRHVLFPKDLQSICEPPITAQFFHSMLEWRKTD